MMEIVAYLFDQHLGGAVVNSTLAANWFDVPFVNRKQSRVCFVAGQPLGSYSSWPLFALFPCAGVALCGAGLPGYSLTKVCGTRG